MLKLNHISDPIYPDDIVELFNGQYVKIKAIAISNNIGSDNIGSNYVYCDKNFLENDDLVSIIPKTKENFTIHKAPNIDKTYHCYLNANEIKSKIDLDSFNRLTKRPKWLVEEFDGLFYPSVKLNKKVNIIDRGIEKTVQVVGDGKALDGRTIYFYEPDSGKLGLSDLEKTFQVSFIQNDKIDSRNLSFFYENQIIPSSAIKFTDIRVGDYLDLSKCFGYHRFNRRTDSSPIVKVIHKKYNEIIFEDGSTKSTLYWNGKQIQAAHHSPANSIPVGNLYSNEAVNVYKIEIENEFHLRSLRDKFSKKDWNALAIDLFKATFQGFISWDQCFKYLELNTNNLVPPEFLCEKYIFLALKELIYLGIKPTTESISSLSDFVAKNIGNHFKIYSLLDVFKTFNDNSYCMNKYLDKDNISPKRLSQTELFETFLSVLDGYIKGTKKEKTLSDLPETHRAAFRIASRKVLFLWNQAILDFINSRLENKQAKAFIQILQSEIGQLLTVCSLVYSFEGKVKNEKLRFIMEDLKIEVISQFTEEVVNSIFDFIKTSGLLENQDLSKDLEIIENKLINEVSNESV